MAIPTIATPRLRLRAFTDADAERLHHLMGEKDVLRYFPTTVPPAREQVEALIAGQRSHWATHGHGLWAVESRASGALMGRSGLQYISATGEVEVDFLLGPAFWGQGYATEAGAASLRHAFETVRLEQVIGIVHPEHTASQHVLEKLGLRRMERTRYFGMDCFRYLIERSWYEERADAAERNPHA